MDRPTITIKLPISKLTAKVVTYWTRGDQNYIQQAALKGTVVSAEMGMDGNLKRTSKTDATTAIEVANRSLEKGVLELLDVEGNQVAGSMKDLVNDLPEDDVLLLDDALSFEAKKKS